MSKLFAEKLKALQNGSYDVFYRQKRYLLRKETHLDGRLIKLYAEELGGSDFISLNYYTEVSGGLLKPCEMPKEKVISFIMDIECD
ncbi:hypothetical protein [Sulfurimonas sp.]